MNCAFIVTGTDTGIGKTVFSAALAGALSAYYWKPVQSGLEEATDSETVVQLAGLSRQNIIPECWRLNTPASPHLSAQIDGVEIDAESLSTIGRCTSGDRRRRRIACTVDTLHDIH